MAENLEEFLPGIRENGISTAKNIVSSGTNTWSGTNTFTGARISNIALAPIMTYTALTAINTSATVTAAQLLTGYLTSTSAAGVTMTLPTGTNLGGAISGCARGTTFDFIVDNTAGANTVTMAVNTNAVQSDWDIQITTATASVTPAAITPLTIASGTLGIATYKVVFASATAYVFSRVS